MKKIFTLLFALILFAGSSWGQVSSYTFASSSGTYTAISGGTVLGTTTSDDQVFNNSTTGASPSVTSTGFSIGFNFTYNGNVYDKFAVNNNGWIILGTGTFTISGTYTPISVTGPAGYVSAISPLGFDIQGQTGSELSYLTSGSAPNRVLTIQWKGYRAWNATGDIYNFQIQLIETTNQVKFVYGSFTKNATSRSPQVGIRGATNADYNNRTTTTNWAATTAGVSNSATCTLSSAVLPASGLTFTFSVPTGPPNPSSFTATPASSSQINLNWALNPGSNPVMLAYNTSPTFGTPVNGVTYTTTIPGGGTVLYNGSNLTYNHTPLTSNTPYYYKIWSVDGTNTYSGGITATATTLCSSTSVPYTENFDSYTPPAKGCLTVQDVNADGKTWVTYSGSYPTAHSSPNCMMGTYNSSLAANDWFFTQGLDLLAGFTYNVSFWYVGSGTTWPEKLEVKFGTAPNATAMTSAQIWNNSSVTNSSWLQTTPTPSFVAPSTGTYYIGFHQYSAIDEFYLGVDDISVTIVPLPPTITTNAATSIFSTGATLNATVNANFASTTVSFEYGTTPGGPYPNTAAGVPPSVTGNTPTDFNAAITGLVNNTNYYYRAIGVNSAGTTYGLEQTFYTTCSITTPTAGFAPTTFVGFNATIHFSGTPNVEVTYNIDGGSPLTITLDGSGNATLGPILVTAINQTYNLVSARYPAGPDECIQPLSGYVTLGLNTTNLYSNKDTYIEQAGNGNNVNEGNNPLLQICATCQTRVLVGFDLTGVSTTNLASARLAMYIDANTITMNWGGGAPGSSDPSTRYVDAARLLEDWAEGNGCNQGCSPNTRGTGTGATWKSPYDANISNNSPNGPLWSGDWGGTPGGGWGGNFAAPTAPSVLHYNGLVGEVSWDVLQDVLDGAQYGWIIKKTDESQNGRVHYQSRENTNKPRLELTYADETSPVKPTNPGVEGEGIQISVFPNPAQESFTLQIKNSINQGSILTLQDLTGKEILHTALQLQEGVNNYPVSIAGISQGIYVVRLQNGTGVGQTKLIINR